MLGNRGSVAAQSALKRLDMIGKFLKAYSLLLSALEHMVEHFTPAHTHNTYLL
jgi:hypothetical protein